MGSEHHDQALRLGYARYRVRSIVALAVAGALLTAGALLWWRAPVAPSALAVPGFVLGPALLLWALGRGLRKWDGHVEQRRWIEEMRRDRRRP